MDNKFFGMLEDFIKNVDTDDKKELEEKIEKFIENYNEGNFNYENPSLNEAYELLEKANNAKSIKQTLKYAKMAYEMSDECLDAILLQVSLEENPLKRDELLDKGLEHEKERLEKKGYFKKDNLGNFYVLMETRPYLRGLYIKIDFLLLDGKITQAMTLCKNILKLNKNDNMGARYKLMGIYAYLEDENNMLKLYGQYKEDNFEMLFTLFILYYKLGNEKKAKEYLKKSNKVNHNLIKFLQNDFKNINKPLEGFYKRGSLEEIQMYFQEYYYLLATVPMIDYYILNVLFFEDK